MHGYKRGIPGLMPEPVSYTGLSIEAEGQAPRIQSDAARGPVLRVC